ncbi:MAG: tRNA pseudouridine(55) synthase TruB [Chloroflexota bacterium]
MEGLLNVDKPLHLTSHDVVARVRRLCDTRRVGHAGTLDPLASGVLVLAVGRATRLLEYVVGQHKEYQARVRLGQETNTYDGEGEITAQRPVPVTRADVEQALQQFRGDIAQIPPMYSALKKGGKRLYELARQGKEVEREARRVTIYDLEILTWDRPMLTVRVRCSTGTYIRSLAHDLGQALGTGAYLSGLRRTAIGAFSVQDAAPLADLTADNIGSYLLPPERAVAHLPRLVLSEEDALRLAQGQRLTQGQRLPSRADGEEGEETLAGAYDEQGRFVGVVQAEEGRWRPRKIFYEPA